MRSRIRWPVLLMSAVLVAAMGLPASAEHKDDPRTKNLHPMGHIVEPGVLGGFGGADPNIKSDIAFWGKLAIHGSWLGFSIRDVSAPGNPKTISSVDCDGNQGDVVVWENIVVRSWNTPAGTPGAFGAGTTCHGEDVPLGFEGLHIFDISDPANPVLVADIEMSARPEADAPGRGSHTATGVPDLANNRLLIYNSASSGAHPGIDIVEIPLDDPSSPSYVRFVPSGRSCHDTGVILGDVNMAACAGGNGFTVWDLDPNNLDDPAFRYSVDVNDHVDDGGEVSIGHSAAFTWDGEVIVFGHEPGGGVQANCQETNPDSDKSMFFFRASDGGFLGMWTLPRDQGPTENCTIHNFNVVPLRSGKYVVVSGNYQAGTWVTEFTDPANPRTLAWSDPPPVPTPPGSPFCCDVAGAWSSYWYNNFIYETNFGEGLNIFRFSGPETAGAIRLPHLNPQTQEFSL